MRYRDIPVHRLAFEEDREGSEDLAARVLGLRREVASVKRYFAPQLIHLNAGGATDFFHFLTANAHPAPMLAALHGQWSRTNDPIVRRTLESAGWVVGCSAFIVEVARELVPTIASRSSVIPNGLNPPPIAPSPLPTENPRLVCVGRLAHEKGVDLALAAFASVSARFPRARLLVAGDGPSRPVLERHVLDLDLGGRVELLGAVSRGDVFRLLDSATAVLVPSRDEAFGLAALEAAWMARPVVASRVGGLPEVVEDGTTGLLVEPESVEALAGAVVDLLLHPDTAASMGQAARRRAETSFGGEQYADAYDDLYRRLVR
jgi:glycogen(starch) synthase